MRLDVLLVDKGFFLSRNKAREAITRGEIYVAGKVETKAAKDVADEEIVEVRATVKPFVSMGGYKLEKAVCEFNPEIKDKIFIDAGASTGGFTDCLLRRGAKKVYCVDVGRGLLDKSIAENNKVVIMDETNVRYLAPADFDEVIDAAVADCSFISLEYVLPVLKKIVKNEGYIIALIKPQFELDKKIKLKNGIVRSKTERFSVIKKLVAFAESLSLSVIGITEAPLKNDKNVEYLIYIFNGKGAFFDLTSRLNELK